ncbi:PAS domain S-box protein [bacterium]|nr:PAS domain S-box protein [bacterium]
MNRNRDAFIRKIIEKFGKIDPKHIGLFFTRLSREKNFLEDIFNVLDEGIIVLGEDKNILFINHNAKNIFQVSHTDIIGKNILKYLPDQRLNFFIDEIWKLSEKTINTEISLNTPILRNYSVTIINYFFYEDNLNCKIFVFNDITDKKEQLEQLLHHEKISAVNLLSAGVAHEIGNPLNSLNIHLQLLQQELISLESPKKNSLLGLANVAAEEINRLDAIIKKFLKTIRPFRLNIKENNILGTVKQVLKVMEPEIKNAGLILKKSLDAEIENFLYDEDLMKQALENVIKNAVQACEYGDTIQIDILKLKNNYCKITVTDSGKGIDRNILNKIFDPYFTTREDGSGLGLMMVKRILNAHDGEVSVISEKDKGTSVVLTIPVRKIGRKLLTHQTGD